LLHTSFCYIYIYVHVIVFPFRLFTLELSFIFLHVIDYQICLHVVNSYDTHTHTHTDIYIYIYIYIYILYIFFSFYYLFDLLDLPVGIYCFWNTRFITFAVFALINTFHLTNNNDATNNGINVRITCERNIVVFFVISVRNTLSRIYFQTYSVY